jgi:hypothetical protein
MVTRATEKAPGGPDKYWTKYWALRALYFRQRQRQRKGLIHARQSLDRFQFVHLSEIAAARRLRLLAASREAKRKAQKVTVLVAMRSVVIVEGDQL